MKRTRLAHDWFADPLPVNVFFGHGSWLYSSFAFRHYRSKRPRGLTVGRHSGVYHGSFFDLGVNGEVAIGNYCTLVGVIICSDQCIVIEDYVLIAHDVVLADSFGAFPPAFGEESPVRGHSGRTAIHIGENAWIGAKAVLLDGARIGEGAIVAAGAVVNFVVPPYTIAAGNPGRMVGRIANRQR